MTISQYHGRALEKHARGEIIKRVVSGVGPAAGRAGAHFKPPKNVREMVDNLTRNLRGAKPISGAEAAKLGPDLKDLGAFVQPPIRRAPPIFAEDVVPKMLKWTGPVGTSIGALLGGAVGAYPGLLAGTGTDVKRMLGKYPNKAEFLASHAKFRDRLVGYGGGIGAGAVVGGMLGGRRGLLKFLSKAKGLRNTRSKILDAIARNPEFGSAAVREFDPVLGKAMGDASLRIVREGGIRGAKGGALAGIIPGIGLGEGLSRWNKHRSMDPKNINLLHRGVLYPWWKEKGAMEKEAVSVSFVANVMARANRALMKKEASSALLALVRLVRMNRL